MAIQDNNFGLIAVRVLTGCEERYRKNLTEGRFYFFNDRYTNVGENVVPNPNRSDVPSDFFGQNISVQAVCGVNGAGKSTLFEMVYRIINNLSCLLECNRYRGGSASRLWYIEDVRAMLWYEQDNHIYTIGCNDRQMYFEGEDVPRINMQVGNRTADAPRETIYRHLFYTLVTNYSMQSLVPMDYESDATCSWDGAEGERNWMEGIYRKNDGYLVAMGFEPYKWGNQYNIETQAELLNARAALLLLDNEDFVSGYVYQDITFEFDRQFYHSKAQNTEFREHVEQADLLLMPNSDCLAIMMEAFEIDRNLVARKDRRVVALSMAYIFDKLWSVADNYPTFSAFRGQFDRIPNDFNITDAQTQTIFSALCEHVYTEPSHISTKIIQSINFIKAYLTHDVPDHECNLLSNFSYDRYWEAYCEGQHYHSLEEHERHFIPPFYKMTIYLRNMSTNALVEYARLSSGERQFVQQMGSCIYHIRNLMSVEDYQQGQDFERPKYHHFNLILDEIELCFHPEYQRMFLCWLIETIKKMGINRDNHVNDIGFVFERSENMKQSVVLPPHE